MATSKMIVIYCIVFLLVAFTMAQVEDVSFSYVGSKGPDTWGKLNPNNVACSKGKNQSPINIEKSNVVLNKSLGALTPNYHPTNATFDDNQFNVAVRWNGDIGGIRIGGKLFVLKQMHWHTPSEHTIDGIRYPVELHLVHKSEDNQLAVLGALFKYGKPDSFLVAVESELIELAKQARSGNTDAHIAMGKLKLRLLHSNHTAYYRYMGSLTTPPCSENVIWNILTKVRSITQKQVEELRAPLPLQYRRNRRPVQPLNGRIVYKFGKNKG